MSSDTELTQLDEAELHIVSGGQLSFALFGANYTLTGNQLTETYGNTSHATTLSSAQAAALTTVVNFVKAGNYSNLNSDIAVLKGIKALLG